MVFEGHDESHTEFPTAPAQVRELYDQLLQQEISEDDHLDGELFRKGRAAVSDGQKEIHVGVTQESEIISRVQVMLDSQRPEHPHQLINACVAHFMLEHTHPFLTVTEGSDGSF